MAKSRFESYVEERVGEIAAKRRKKLQAAYDAEVEKTKKQSDKYLKMVVDGAEALIQKIVMQARKDGCLVNGKETKNVEVTLTNYVEGQVKSLIGLQLTYNYDLHENQWSAGTPARKAQDALREFDTMCAKEAKRIAVYKMDLGMKPEAFEKMLAEVAERINKE